MEKVKIISDGTPNGTVVLFRGEALPFVQCIDYRISLEGSQAILSINNVECEIVVNNAAVKTIMEKYEITDEDWEWIKVGV
jgi:hypothetical protein